MLSKLKHLCVIISLLLSVSSFGQNYNNHISVSFGPSFPTGNFAAAVADNESAGYARTGVAARLVYQKNISDQMGFVVTAFGQKNNFKTDELARQLTEASSAGTGTFNWSVNKAAWKMAGILPGLAYTVPLNENETFFLNSRATFGAVFAKSPSIEAGGKSTNAYAISRQSDAQSWGTAAAIASGLSYQISPMFSIMTDLEFITTSELTFKDVYVLSAATEGGLVVPELYQIENSVNPPTVIEAAGDFKQKLNSLNLRVGVKFSF